MLNDFLLIDVVITKLTFISEVCILWCLKYVYVIMYANKQTFHEYDFDY